MHTTLSIITFTVGLALFVTTRRERDQLPRGFPLVAPGVTALGLSSLLLERPGFWWSIASSVLSIVAIVCIGAAMLIMLRAGKRR